MKERAIKMPWSKVKRLFKKKKKPKKDEVISFYGGEVELKELCVCNFLDDIPHGMRLHTKFIKRQNGSFLWQVNEIVIEAEDIISAQRKYLRQKRNDDKQ